MLFSGNEEAGHLRRVGVSGGGWTGPEKSERLARTLRKMGEEPLAKDWKAVGKAQLN